MASTSTNRPLPEETDEEPEQCRVCTIRSDCFSYFNIHERILFKNVGVASALGMVTSLEISAEDTLPQTICCRCEQRLLDAYHFRKLAESSARSFAKLAPQKSPPSPPVATQKQTATSASATSDDAIAEHSTQIARQQLLRNAQRKIKKEPETSSTPKTPAIEFEEFAHEQLLVAVQDDDQQQEQEKDDRNSTTLNHNTESNDDAAIMDSSSLTLEVGEHSNSFKIVYDKEPALLRRSAKQPLKPKKSTEPAEVSIEVVDEQLDEDDEDGVSFLRLLIEPAQEPAVKVSPKSTKRKRNSEGKIAAKKPSPRATKKTKKSAEERDSADIDIKAVEPELAAKKSPVKTVKTTSPIKSPAAKTSSIKASQSVKPSSIKASPSIKSPPTTKLTVNNDGSPVQELTEEYMRRKHVCEVCNKRFIGRSNLVDHLRHHANVKMYQCEYCDKSFVQKGSLVCHIRTHTKEKPFSCDVCHKTFSQASSRQIHMRTHTNQRDYVCKQCSKSFYSNTDLVKHTRTHDLIKMFRCDFCPYNFAQRCNLKKHVQKKHPETLVD